MFPEAESTGAAILEEPRLTHGCWEEARQTDPPSVRPPTLYSPPVPLDHPELGREGWTTGRGVATADGEETGPLKGPTQ